MTKKAMNVSSEYIAHIIAYLLEQKNYDYECAYYKTRPIIDNNMSMEDIEKGIKTWVYYESICNSVIDEVRRNVNYTIAAKLLKDKLSIQSTP
jgi:hypothetical protein